MDAANIILGYKPPQIDTPLEAQTKKINLQALLQAKQINDAKIMEMNDQINRRKGLRDLLANTDESGRIPALVKGGYLDEAKDLTAQNLAAQKAKDESANSAITRQKEKTKQIGQAMGFLMQNPSVDNLQSVLGDLTNRGIMTSDEANTAFQNGPKDPEGIKQLATRHFYSALDADKQLGKIEARNLGGTNQIGSVNPVTNTYTPIDTQTVTPTQDQLSDNLRMEAQNKETLRHNQAMEGLGAANNRVSQARLNFEQSGGVQGVNARNANMKPLPAPALKMQQESLDALSTAAQIDSDLGGVLGMIDKGQIKLGPAQNLISQARNATGMSDETSRNYQTLKATMEKMRNDSLRLNKGVQTEGDAQRAWNELMSNLNDTNNVKQQLQRIRSINQRAITLQRNNIDQIRQNYGKEPLDTSQFDTQPAVTQPSGLPSQDAIAAEIARRKKK